MSKPRWLKTPHGIEGRALSIWKDLAPSAARKGYLSAGNAEHFRSLCRILALCDSAAAQIERDGPTVKSETGVIRPHPAVNILLVAQREARPLLRQFGLDRD